LDGAVQVVRAGPISAEQLEKVLGQKVVTPEHHQIKVSGNMAAHYQPQTTLRCVSASELHALVETKALKLAVLSFSEQSYATRLHWQYRMPNDAMQYGRDLYKQLYLADQSGAELILVENPPSDSTWLAVQNRLMRAAWQGS
jgi:L-threonylcarbamoyladenylate synthase